MKLIEKLKLFVICKKKILVKYKNFFIFRNTDVNISTNALCIIKKYCSINEPWGKKNLKKNSAGVFRLGDFSQFVCNDMSIHSGCRISVKKGASLILGSGFINSNCEIRCSESISIGENVAIAPEVIIRDSDDHQIVGSKKTSPINIGNHVWIGTRAMILKGVSIGDNSVIAAGSIVTHDVPSNCLVAGVPAIIKKEKISWE